MVENIPRHSCKARASWKIRVERFRASDTACIAALPHLDNTRGNRDGAFRDLELDPIQQARAQLRTLHLAHVVVQQLAQQRADLEQQRTKLRSTNLLILEIDAEILISPLATRRALYERRDRFRYGRNRLRDAIGEAANVVDVLRFVRWSPIAQRVTDTNHTLARPLVLLDQTVGLLAQLPVVDTALATIEHMVAHDASRELRVERARCYRAHHATCRAIRESAILLGAHQRRTIKSRDARAVIRPLITRGLCRGRSSRRRSHVARVIAKATATGDPDPEPDALLLQLSPSDEGLRARSFRGLRSGLVLFTAAAA